MNRKTNSEVAAEVMAPAGGRGIAFSSYIKAHSPVKFKAGTDREGQAGTYVGPSGDDEVKVRLDDGGAVVDVAPDDLEVLGYN